MSFQTHKRFIFGTHMKTFLIKSERFLSLHWQGKQLPLWHFKKFIKRLNKLIHINVLWGLGGNLGAWSLPKMGQVKHMTKLYKRKQSPLKETRPTPERWSHNLYNVNPHPISKYPKYHSTPSMRPQQKTEGLLCSCQDALSSFSLKKKIF